MTTRRDFLKVNFAAMTALMSGHTLGMTGSATEAERVLSIFIVDGSLQIPKDVVPPIPAHIGKVVELKDDLDDIWMKDIVPHIRTRKAVIGGITPGIKAFTLQEAARDQGYEIVELQQLTKSVGQSNEEAVAFLMSRDYQLPVAQLNNMDATFWVLAPSGINFGRA